MNKLDVYVNKDMVGMAGKTARITSITSGFIFPHFIYNISGSDYNWTELEFVKQVRMK